MRHLRAVSAPALVLLLGASAGWGQEPSASEIKTPLHLLGHGGTLMVSAVETNEAAPPISATVRFLDERGRLVKRVVGEFGPRNPLLVGVSRSELRGTEPFAAVRAVVDIKRPDGFGRNQAAIRFALFEKGGATGCGSGCSICPRVSLTTGQDLSCAAHEGGRGPEVICDGDILVTNFTAQ
jgi:hypothetical protein